MKARVTERRSTLLIAVVWIVAVLLSSPILVYRRQFVRQWLDHTEIWCDDTWPPVSLMSLSFFNFSCRSSQCRNVVEFSCPWPQIDKEYREIVLF